MKGLLALKALILSKDFAFCDGWNKAPEKQTGRELVCTPVLMNPVDQADNDHEAIDGQVHRRILERDVRFMSEIAQQGALADWSLRPEVRPRRSGDGRVEARREQSRR